METTSSPGCIQCPEETAKLIKEQDWTIALTRRGYMNIKGKGKMSTFWIGRPPVDSAAVLPTQCKTPGTATALLGQLCGDSQADYCADNYPSEFPAKYSDAINMPATLNSDSLRFCPQNGFNDLSRPSSQQPDWM
mmetsp:Transcript_30916/g.64833  ORF Transcript_30916/g.64833 Transcript_30916/m.64833 type:complete len:135 (-) Transcript_30916:227-631(-)